MRHTYRQVQFLDIDSMSIYNVRLPESLNLRLSFVSESTTRWMVSLYNESIRRLVLRIIMSSNYRPADKLYDHKDCRTRHRICRYQLGSFFHLQKQK